MKVLMVLTSHDELGDTGRKTGFWLEELAAPYYEFKDVGAQITLASPKGGRPPLDTKSQDPSFQTDLTRRFEKDTDAEGQLDETLRLESVKQTDYDPSSIRAATVRCGTWPKTPVKLIESFLAAGKPVALVCHAPGVLRRVNTPADKPLVEGKKVTGFTDGEEADMGLTKVVPFLVEDELLGLGATFSEVKNWGVLVVTDGLLITGQNPASSGPTPKVLIDTLNANSHMIDSRWPTRGRRWTCPSGNLTTDTGENDGQPESRLRGPHPYCRPPRAETVPGAPGTRPRHARRGR